MGGNYGWPLITYGVNYDGSSIIKDTAKGGMEPPLTYWMPSIAVCTVEFANSLYVSKLERQHIRHGIEI